MNALFEEKKNEERNIVVLGGSYSGAHAAQYLSQRIPSNYRIILIDKNSHFHHLYVLPRFHLIGGHEHKAFIPYSGIFKESNGQYNGIFLQSLVKKINSNWIEIDTEDTKGIQLPFDYLIYALGAQVPTPMNGLTTSYRGSLDWLRASQKQIQQYSKILIVGGGALGIQFAGDIKELMPEKKVTLVHSRDKLLPLYLPEMHDGVMNRMNHLGVEVILGQRIKIPYNGFPSDGNHFEVETVGGDFISCDCVLLCTGQRFNTSLIEDFNPLLVNGDSREINVKETLQMNSEDLEHMFAIGDSARTGATKTGNAGWYQAEIASKNILSLIQSRKNPVLENYKPGTPQIKITIGLSFRISQLVGIDGQPYIKEDNEGTEDLHASQMWPLYGAEERDTIN
eukprot:TRINITY_DN7114_c0_g2_i1.p1 TRINITY_DN7114_c0_g2~~TRINITY_DN7114_c0_g2_i1.p1  ORF type:complete len:395 (-),score=121.91 TRINITY_DN7114_c0_g2_i1:32-1216(-)